jgi:hypothetical protein
MPGPTGTPTDRTAQESVDLSQDLAEGFHSAEAAADLAVRVA